MKRKLFGYMVLLACMVLTAFVIGLSLIGRFNSTEEDYYETLDLQMEVFEKDMEVKFEYWAFMGIHLSENMTDILDGYLESQGSLFDDDANSYHEISKLQELMIVPLKQQLLQVDCSGAFVMLNTTVGREDGEKAVTKSGIYLQKSGFTESGYDDNLLLYRGDAQIGKKHQIMPHRKWRLEFENSLFSGYEEAVSKTAAPAQGTYLVTGASVLPGTSEKAMFLILPMIGETGIVYGICGFEINESYFKSRHAQASNLPHLTCVLAITQGSEIDTTAGLSSGVLNGYYLAPEDKLAYGKTERKLYSFSGEDAKYIGLKENVSLCPEDVSHLLVVMIPERDYKSAFRTNIIKTLVLLCLLIIVTVICCLYLSRRFVHPILKSLEMIKNNEKGRVNLQLHEINDMFAFLSEKDQKSEELLKNLEQEKEQAQKAYEQAQEKIERLAYSRKQEIDPDDYECFLEGLELLTPTEKKIFEYYLSGNTVKEIMRLASIKESTLRYHNQNIYRKLGVNSLKQMLRYATLWKQGEEKNRQGE